MAWVTVGGGAILTLSCSSRSLLATPGALVTVPVYISYGDVEFTDLTLINTTLNGAVASIFTGNINVQRIQARGLIIESDLFTIRDHGRISVAASSIVQSSITSTSDKTTVLHIRGTGSIAVSNVAFADVQIDECEFAGIRDHGGQ